jgi:hypothetical protein
MKSTLFLSYPSEQSEAAARIELSARILNDANAAIKRLAS